MFNARGGVPRIIQEFSKIICCIMHAGHLRLWFIFPQLVAKLEFDLAAFRSERFIIYTVPCRSFGKSIKPKVDHLYCEPEGLFVQVDNDTIIARLLDDEMERVG